MRIETYRLARASECENRQCTVRTIGILSEDWDITARVPVGLVLPVRTIGILSEDWDGVCGGWLFKTADSVRTIGILSEDWDTPGSFSRRRGTPRLERSESSVRIETGAATTVYSPSIKLERSESSVRIETICPSRKYCSAILLERSESSVRIETVLWALWSSQPSRG